MVEDRARWAELIATSLQVSGLGEEDLERKLGWTPGSLGRLLDGEGDLAPDQVLEILGELNESSLSRKNSGKHGDGVGLDGETGDAGDDRSQMVMDLLERYRLLGYETRQVAPPPAEPLSLKELEMRVEAILRRAYGERLRREPPAEE